MDSWPPKEIPDIPQEIVQEASEGNLVVFIGAGASMLMGGPSWDKLANDVLSDLASQNHITFGNVEQLRHLDPRKRLTIASLIAQKESTRVGYERIFDGYRRNNSKIYEYIRQIGCVYVTTNYDEFLYCPLKVDSVNPQNAAAMNTPERICRREQFLPGKLREPGTTIHLHGCIVEPDSMIITTLDYLKHYSDEYVQAFLNELFEKYTVLFVGYGLEETEILEYILSKGEAKTSTEQKRFILQGFYHHQEQVHSCLNEYYKKCFGTKLLPFSLEYQQHKQLEAVMKNWAAKVIVNRPPLAGDIRDIEEVLGES